MSDRHKGYIVTLEKDLKDEDSIKIIDALKLIKGVISVDPIVDDMNALIAESRARQDLGTKILKVIYPNIC